MVNKGIFSQSRGKLRFIKRLLSSPQRKHTVHWLRSLQENYALLEASPWICFDATQFIKSSLAQDSQVFEYGSGGSTLFWLNHAAKVVSVEHDQSWYQALQARISSPERLDYRFVPPTCHGSETLAADLAAYTTRLPEYAGCHFKPYCSQIDEFPDAHFDVVSVDGRARAACIRHAHKKVKIGGMLILDNSEREIYREAVANFLHGYQRHTFFGATPGVFKFTEASVFVRTA